MKFMNGTLVGERSKNLTDNLADDSVRITFLDGDGGDFASFVDVPKGITVEDLFATAKPGAKATDYSVRVGRDIVPGSQVLVTGDKVLITPKKIVAG